MFPTKRIGFVLFLISICCGSPSFAQDQPAKLVYTADSLKNGAIDLSKIRWKFHSGDDTSWSAPDLNDTDWGSVTTDLSAASVETHWTGIGWFRLHFYVDSSLTELPLALFLMQNGASEVYLNGKRVGGHGRVSSSAKTEKTYVAYDKIPSNPPFLVHLIPNHDNVFAVRYSDHQLKKLDRLYLYSGFFPQLVDMNYAIHEQQRYYQDYYSYMTLLIGITLAIFLLHILIFIFYPEKPTNLYYAITIGILAVLATLQLVSDFVHDPTYYTLCLWLQLFIYVLLPLGVLRFSYALNHRITPWHYYLKLAIGIILIILSWVYLLQVKFYCSIFLLILFIEAAYQIILNPIHRKNRSYIVTIGFLITVVLTIIQILSNLGWIGPVIGTERGLLAYYGILGIVFSMSVYLAKDVRDTNRDLRRQLSEVKRLSQVTLEQGKREAELKLNTEREQAKSREALLRARAAELQLQVRQAEHERRQRELEEARKLQLSMLPRKLPDNNLVEMAVFMQTATEVGGDYYDFREHPDNSLTVVVGDATGHGLKAGTLVTTVKSLFTRQKDSKPIPQQFQDITAVIREMNLGILYMGLTMVHLHNSSEDGNTNLTMSTAGMPPALLYHSETHSVDTILIKGMPLGSVKNFPYREHSYTLHSGDILMLLSDGMPELFNEDREMYGLDRLSEVFSQSTHLSPEKIIRKLQSEITMWLNGKQPEDDITFVVLKVR